MTDNAEHLRQELTARLLTLQADDGHWEGRLSSSALATAVAVFALHQADAEKHAALVGAGLAWLVRVQNRDGGWGDTPDSPSNLSTTLLAWAALGVAPEAPTAAVAAAERWLDAQGCRREPAALAAAVLAAYGNDRTFSAPILALLAVAGRLGAGRAAWRQVPQLPFELAALPPALFRFIGLPVVSYALPALIAIGLARQRCGGAADPVRGSIRKGLTACVMRRLERIQPDNGGFLEAAPLTAFVLLNLAAAGFREHPVARRCAAFLAESARPDGSWPIDTHLATWVTTLAVKALAAGGPGALADMPAGRRQRLTAWLLARQQVAVHPYTQAAPGGWAWTPRAGGVPDADDTAGAMLALQHLTVCEMQFVAGGQQAEAAARGMKWLLGLQNRDGGVPTFCRGWGHLPFDRSCPDITAHALQAYACLSVADATAAPAGEAMADGAAHPGVLEPYRMLKYLAGAQRSDGAWVPLWFGNQRAPGRENPVYGTAQVLAGLAALCEHDCGGLPQGVVAALMRRGVAFLVRAQNPDGGWGGAPGVPSSWEETGAAVAALAAVAETPDDVIGRGIHWLAGRFREDPALTPAPIGLYFQSLWYSEALYPLIFAVQALQTVHHRRAHLLCR